jgi:hypothetical protein
VADPDDGFDGQPVNIGKQPPEQPEQPETEFSASGANGLDSGGMSGLCSANGQQQPEQPDLDIPAFLRRPEAAADADDFRHLAITTKPDLQVIADELRARGEQPPQGGPAASGSSEKS